MRTVSPALGTRPPAPVALTALGLALALTACGEGDRPPPADLPPEAAAVLVEPGPVPPALLPLDGIVERVAVGLRGAELIVATRPGAGDPVLFTRHVWDGEATAWSRGESLPFVDPDGGDADPVLSPDGIYLLFSSHRASGDPSASDSNIWVAQREEDDFGETLGWSRPWLLPGVNSPAWDGKPSMAGDGSLWFASRREGPATGANLFVASFQEGRWSTPERLPDPLNSEHEEGDPFIAPDRSFLLFASDREGQWDLYVSYREGVAWGEVQKLGTEVNTRGDERAPWLSSAGRTLFFVRDGVLHSLPASRAGVVRPEREGDGPP